MKRDLRVLVVEDHPVDSNCIMRQLEHIHCACRATESHDSALDLLERDEQINTVLLDHGTTHGRVADFVSAARSIRPGIKIIGCSGSDCRREFAAAGVKRFLLKPTNVSDLQEVLGLVKVSSREASDTRIGKSNSDTTGLRFSPGESVRIAVGAMEGLEGTVVAQRTGGRILLQLAEGVFVEVHQYCVERTA